MNRFHPSPLIILRCRRKFYESRWFQSKPRLQALKPPILLVSQDESRVVSVIQRCTAFEDEIEEHKRRTEQEELESEVRENVPQRLPIHRFGPNNVMAPECELLFDE